MDWCEDLWVISEIGLSKLGSAQTKYLTYGHNHADGQS